MEVAHEVPLELLDISKIFNDYDYALVHLFEEHPSYYSFFEDSLLEGRRVILDNSLFELGESFEADRFAYWIKKLKPTEYIVPDAWGDKNLTINQFKDFTKKYPNLPGKAIGVVQGSTWTELFECYRFMSEHADKIAITFGLPCYLEQFGDNFSKDEKLVKARQRFVYQLSTKKILNKKKPHHLLGCALPYEFSFYRDSSFIETIDTSSPIMAGINNVRYSGDKGLETKPEGKLADNLLAELTFDQTSDIIYNIRFFKQLIKDEKYLSLEKAIIDRELFLKQKKEK